jgi:hypothetical protein
LPPLRHEAPPLDPSFRARERARQRLRHKLQKTERARRLAAGGDALNDKDLAAEVLKRLIEFSPAVTVTPGEHHDQVQVSIVMARQPITGLDDMRAAEQAASETYRAMRDSASPNGGGALHLVSDHGEASLCGIPSSQLDVDGHGGVLICTSCVTWLPRRREAAARHPAAPAS